MKELFLMRHAKSSWKEPGQADFERPLNERGKRDATRMGEFLVGKGFIPDLAVTSPAKRARKTAQRVLEAMGRDVPLREESQLYGGGSAAWFECVRSVSDEIDGVLIVGHNPDVEEVVGILSGTFGHMPTAAVAHFRAEAWSDIDLPGRMEWVDLSCPKEIE